MAWKKILLTGDAAELTTGSPVSVGTSMSSGVGTEAARYDHVHDLGVGSIDASNLFGSGVVDAAAIASLAVGSAELATDSVIAGKIANGAIDASALFAASVVDNAAMADSAIAAAEIDTSATNIKFSQVTLIPKATGTTLTVGGTVYFNSADAHAYIYQV